MTPVPPDGDPSATQAGCLCKGCGARYRVDLMLPDYLWSAVSADAPDAMLCGACIVRRVEALAAAAGGFGYMLVGESHRP